MGLISDYVCVDLSIGLLTVAVGVFTYFKWSFKYWDKRNVPYAEPKFPFGTVHNPFGKAVSFGERTKNTYDEYKARGYKHVGLFIFTRPIYMVIHPEYIRNILTRDFDHFVDRGVYHNEKDDPLSAHLFSIEGTKWKDLRVKISPSFSSSKLKMMFATLVECGNQVRDLMDGINSKNEPANIKDVAARFTTDIIGSSAFGLNCNTCKEPNSEFIVYGKRLFCISNSENCKRLITFGLPRLSRFLGLTVTPKEVADFFMNIIRRTVQYREENNVQRKDFMQLLIDLKNSRQAADGKRSNGLTMEQLAAQAFIFFVGGFETSATTMTFCLYELALNPNIQQRLRGEVNDVLKKHSGKITHEAILEMKYMGQVIDETLRKYPPLPVLNRICVKDYRVPGTEVVIEKGTSLLIPVLGLQRDPEYYHDPEKFDPDRFSQENRRQITPYTYLPFGDGPRVCIGVRFGLMQTKVGLAVLLHNYRFTLNNKTISPLEMDPSNFIMSAIGDVWLNVQKIDI